MCVSSECVKCVCVVEQATQYVISVRAFNDIDKGPVIYDLVYTASNQGATRVLSRDYHSGKFIALCAQTDFVSINKVMILPQLVGSSVSKILFNAAKYPLLVV